MLEIKLSSVSILLSTHVRLFKDKFKEKNTYQNNFHLKLYSIIENIVKQSSASYLSR